MCGRVILNSALMRRRITLLILALASAAEAATPAIERQFEATVRPFIVTYCAGCHSGSSAAAQFDLKSYTTLNLVTRDYPRWALVAHRLEAHEMPPKTVPQPPAEARERVIHWISAVRDEEIRRHAGDPGTVLARRLSNAEYNDTIRDLTGQDLQPAREFPVDPANPAGFDNSGESLTMSPALLNKYLQAARSVADHVVLKPDGIDFAPYPMRVETDREKYAIEQILNFYARQPTDFAKYFEAAWQFEHRGELGKPHATLNATATESRSEPAVSGDGVADSRRTRRAGAGREAAGDVARTQGGLAAGEMLGDARFRDANPEAYRRAVRRADRERIAGGIAAFDELEASRVRAAPS